MIIAIDEVGDFAPTSQRYNFFIAALVSQIGNSVETKRQHFEEWKGSLQAGRFTKQGEIKGTELTSEELLIFVRDVIIAEPHIVPVQIRIIPKENSVATLQSFQQVELDAITLSMEYFKEHGMSEREVFFRKMRNWYRNRNYQHFLKMAALEHCIGRALQYAIGRSIFDSYVNASDDNLMNLRIKIDKDFINKAGEIKYFQELLRQAFRSITERYPIPIAVEMVQNNHPFVQAYLLENGKINMAQLFLHNCTFESSHTNFELQIADILGTVFHRFFNKNQCQDSIDLINESLGSKGQVRIHFIANPNPDTEAKIVIE
jgi:hypothetical protein